MRLVTFTTQSGEPRLGALADGDSVVVDLTGAAPHLSSMQALIEAGAEGLEAARRAAGRAAAEHRRPRDSVRLLAPLPRPEQIRDFVSFEQHLIGSYEAAIRIRAAQAPDPAAAEAELRASGRFAVPEVWYRQPLYYKGNRFATVGTGAEITWPAYSTVMDFELELAAVIGRRVKDVRREEARAAVFGYTVFNDLSARDAQLAEMAGGLGPAKGKDFDGANVFGPCLVTADEIGDPYALTMIARVNGVEWARGSSSTMHWKFEDLIAHVSRSETVYPGEIFGSGTVGGGCGAELGRFLQDGDVIELEIEGIGTIANRVRATGALANDGAPKQPAPGPRNQSVAESPSRRHLDRR